MIIRSARAHDVPVVLGLVRSAYRGPSSRAGWTTEADLLDDQRIDADGVAAKVTGEGTAVLVAVEAAEAPPASAREVIVACAEVAHREGGVAYFGMFAVDPARQAGGIGRAVLAAAEAFARSRWGATTMEMTVIGQRVELIAWYRRRGYRVTGERRSFPYDELVGGGALRDDLYFDVLAKPLGQP